MFPAELNYWMPAEWTAHRRTFLSWPVRDSMCFPENYESNCEAYAALVRAIAEFEPVTVLVNPGELERVKKSIGCENVELLPIAHDDSWVRDNGPTFVKNEEGALAGINWHFNAWGGKYARWDLDDAVASEILTHYGVRQFDAPLVMEGGSFHTDGEGTLLTTEQCLLNPNRNPNLTKEQIEDALKRYLHVKKIIWLKGGLSGDETDGHVDNIACFAASGKILMQVCDDPDDANFAITKENLAILKQAVDAKERDIEVIPIAQPPRREYRGERLTLSYLNFYFVNGGIVLPVFGGAAEETDKNAESVLKAVFPQRKIRRIDGTYVIREGGNVHCTTQQMPL